MSISIRGLTHVYSAAGGSVAALLGLDMEFADGEVVVVRGPNGSGKSTLVGILSGTLRPSAGEVTITAARATPHIATIRQFGNVVAELTGDEHAQVINAGVPSGRHVRASAMTVAQRQHLAIDLALLGAPDVVLADEPAATLPHNDALDLYSELASRCRAAGATLLLVSHDIRSEAVADRVVRLRDGRVSETWRPGQSERLAIDHRGWLRLPGPIRGRLGSSAVLGDGDVVTLHAAESVPQTAPPAQSESPSNDWHPQQLDMAPNGMAGMQFAANRVTHVLGPAGPELGRALADIATAASTVGQSVARFSANLPLGTQQTLADMDPQPQWVDVLDLVDLAHRPLATLSGGQRQRAMLCVALSLPVDLLLIEDPTANLDPYWRDTCMAALRRHCAQGHTVIVATHDHDTVTADDCVVHVS